MQQETVHATEQNVWGGRIGLSSHEEGVAIISIILMNKVVPSSPNHWDLMYIQLFQLRLSDKSFKLKDTAEGQYG